MRRNGTVAAMSTTRGMVAIATEDDGFTTIELFSDWELHIRDAIPGRTATAKEVLEPKIARVLIGLIKAHISGNWFGESFPFECQNGGHNAGCSLRGFTADRSGAAKG